MCAHAGANVIVEQNWFSVEAARHLAVSVFGGAGGPPKVIVRSNVFGPSFDVSIYLRFRGDSEIVEIVQNTFVGSANGDIALRGGCFGNPFKIKQNLFLGESNAIRYFDGPLQAEDTLIANENCDILGNVFVSNPWDLSPRFTLNNSAQNVSPVLSLDLASSGYLRPLASISAGAFTKEGEEWFASLRNLAAHAGGAFLQTSVFTKSLTWHEFRYKVPPAEYRVARRLALRL